MCRYKKIKGGGGGSAFYKHGVQGLYLKFDFMSTEGNIDWTTGNECVCI